MLREEIIYEDNEADKVVLHGRSASEKIKYGPHSQPVRQRKSAQRFEPILVLQRPSLQSEDSNQSPPELSTKEMVDHLVQTLGLIGVSPTFPRRARPSRISLQHTTSSCKINEMT